MDTDPEGEMQASLKEWQDEVRNIFSLIGLERKPYSINVENVEIQVFPDVFSPKYFTDSAWFATTLPTIVGKSSLLDIGTGTGINAELNKIYKIAESYGYEMLLLAKKDLPISDGHQIVNDYRIYEIKEVGL